MSDAEVGAGHFRQLTNADRGEAMMQKLNRFVVALMLLAPTVAAAQEVTCRAEWVWSLALSLWFMAPAYYCNFKIARYGLPYQER